MSNSAIHFIQIRVYCYQQFECSLGCVPCRAKAPILVHDEKSRQEALLQASLAEARAIEAAAKAAEAAKAAKEAEAAAAARQSEIKAHKPELDHIMV